MRLTGTREVLILNDLVVIPLRKPVSIELKERSRFFVKRLFPGQVSIRPAQRTLAARSADTLEFLTLSFEPGFLEMACGEFIDRRRLKLTMQHGVNDRLVEGVCLALLKEVETGGMGGRLYSDSLATTLAVHLVAQYGVDGKAVKPDWPVGGPAMVRQAMEFMQVHLHRDLSLRDLAMEVGLSPFHFARRFKESVGLSPYQFLLQKRMERARRLLIEGELPVSAIAVEVGFYDQSHFAQHFKRLHSMTPKQFAEQYRSRKKVL